ncbi:GerAB/ArcD/ProY family transporter [Paenibacillus guangzhouensis]|uniref:GerAB/ArcD/ProY family transporter n=1 Tax=Paenibacillus guangzhouensis TaxID=1473112 RepID=UPI001267784F|nr:endospore germination permease [Paenibacillus guangzhouensis]
MDNIKISVRQFTILMILFTIGTAILIIPSTIAAVAKQDAWISALIGIGLGLLLMLIYAALGNQFPGLTLVEMNDRVLGKWIGCIVSLGFLYFTFITSSELLYFVGDFLATQIMPDTPLPSLNVMFAIILLMGVRLGLEAFARAAEILFPLFILLFLILVIFIVPEIDIKNAKPMLNAGAPSIIQASLMFTSVASIPTVTMLMIGPVSLNKPNKLRRSLILGTLIGGAFLFVIVILTVLVLGSDMTARQAFPSYVLAKRVNVGRFLQRIEAIVAVMWIVTIYFRMLIYYYASIVGLAQVLRIKDYRALTLPLGLIAVICSLLIHPNAAHSIQYDKEYWLPYASTFGVFLPLLLLVVALFRKKSAESNNDS